jgi:DNA repair exonuclease SbcCD nuclease subunit
MAKNETKNGPMTKAQCVTLVKELMLLYPVKADLKEAVIRRCKCGKTKAYELIQEAQSKPAQPKAVEEAPKPAPTIAKIQVMEPAVDVHKNYTYNKATGTYTVQTGSGTITLTTAEYSGIRRAYVVRKATIEDIAIDFQIPKTVLKNAITNLGISRDSLPVSDEEVKYKSPAEIQALITEYKKLDVYKEAKKKEQDLIKENSKNWVSFVEGKLKPYEEILQKWTPPKVSTHDVTKVKREYTKDRVYIACAFDWHIGSFAEENKLTHGKEWNSKVAEEAVKNYAKQTAIKVNEDKLGFEKGVILFGGDLFHTITGFTSNNTPLKCDVHGGSQFKLAMDLIILFIDEFSRLFNKTEVYYVKGNHGSLHDFPMGLLLQSHYRKEENIKVTAYDSRHAMIRFGDVLVAFEHGASGETKSMLPERSAARDSQIKGIFGEYDGDMTTVKQKLYITGDRHHFDHKEMCGYDFIQSGALPTGDIYAEALGKHSRPRQQGIILTKDGLEGIYHFYVDVKAEE